MDKQELRWIKIAATPDEISFGTNGLAEVDANGKKICIGKFKETVFAFAQKCPHAGAQLVHGYIDAVGNVTCQLHRYKFCMKNGRNVTGEGYYLKHWPVAVNEAGVYVGMKPPSEFDYL